MGNQFFPAPEVEEVGRELIREHHVHLLEHNARVEFCFCSETSEKSGKEVWGSAQKISAKQAFLYNFRDAKFEAGGRAKFDSKRLDELNKEFFLITIAEPIWKRLKKRPQARRALVDHFLMHCESHIDFDKNETKLSIVKPDFEGFNEEVRRYGLWRNDAVLMREAMEGAQGVLDLDTPEVRRAAHAIRDMDKAAKDEGVSVTFSAGGKSATIGKKPADGAAQAQVH